MALFCGIGFAALADRLSGLVYNKSDFERLLKSSCYSEVSSASFGGITRDALLDSIIQVLAVDDPKAESSFYLCSSLRGYQSQIVQSLSARGFKTPVFVEHNSQLSVASTLYLFFDANYTSISEVNAITARIPDERLESTKWLLIS